MIGSDWSPIDYEVREEVRDEKGRMSSGDQRRNVLRVVAVIAIVVGVIAGVRIWLAADQRLDDAVAGMARAPVGCDTVLDFDADGTYYVFVETKGELDDVRGDCDVDTQIEWTDDELPAVTLTLVGPEGDEVELESDDGVRYDTGSAAGTSIESVDIETSGDHVMRVESDESGFAIAVGRDPNGGVLPLRLLAVGVAIVGVAIGLVLLLRTRRRRVEPVPAAEMWAPQAGAGPNWPASPPGFPAPPPTTGTTAVVGPPTGPVTAPSVAPLPVPPSRPPSGPSTGSSSVPSIPGQPSHWGPPPPPPPGRRPGT